MAAPAVDATRSAGAGVLALLLRPSPGRIEFATRRAVICAITALCVALYRTPDAALTVYMVFFLNRADRVSSLALNAAVIVLMAVVIALVMGVAMVVIDQPALRVAAIAALSFGFLFLTSASKLKPVGWIMALITGYALDQLGGVPAGELATRALLYAWLFAWIPAAVSIAVNLTIAPSPRRLVERALAERLEVGAAALRRPTAETRARFDAVRREGLGEIPGWLKLAGVERTSPAGDIAALSHAADSTTAILLLLGVALEEPDAGLPPNLGARLASALEEMAAIRRRGGYPVDVEVERLDEAASLAPPVRALWEDLLEALSRFAEPPPAASPRARGSAAGFFLPDAFTNPEHVHYALKTTAAAMLCYGLYTVLHWPSIHTCFITCYIVSLATAGETVEKLTLRIAGCLVGAAAGIAAIVYVVPALTSIGGLMAIVFAGAFVAAWIAGGGPRIAYAGFQIAFAFFICVIQGPSPAFDMAEARDRVIGILIGNLVAYLVFVNLWPVSITRRIDPAIRALLQAMSDLARSPSPSGRRARAAGALAAHSALERDLGLLPYEPHRLRPPADWLRNRSRAVEAVAALIGPLLLAADRQPTAAGVAAHRLDRLADGLAATPAAERDGRQVSQAADELATPAQGPVGVWRLVERPLSALEATLSQTVGERMAEHAQA